MSAQAWWDYPITNPHSSDDGVDIGTPNDTALSFPYAGQVIDASYHVYGGQVVVHMPDGYDEYFIHLDNIYVHPGDAVSPDEIVGTSGGGVGDLLLHNGSVQPAQAQSWYAGHSSGRHTEFGEFRDTSAGGSMSQFNQGWGNPLRQLDPTAIVTALKQRLAPPAQTTAPGASSATQTTALASSGNPLDPSSWPGAIANAFGFSSPQNMLQRVAVGGAGVALAIIGLVVVAQPEVQQVTTAVTTQAARAAGTAAKAAAL